MRFQSYQEGYRHRQQRWKNMHPVSTAMLLLFAFLVFATIGLLSTSVIPHHISAGVFWGIVFTYGIFAVMYAYVSIRIHWLWAFAVMPLEFLVIWWFQTKIHAQPLQNLPAHSEVVLRMQQAIGIAGPLIVVGYMLVFLVLGREGKRLFKVQAEVELASEIHRALVPPINLRVGQFEIYGLSLPSGEVGGDLVDAIVQPRHGRWIAYVADISGHGVSSGVLMAMLKSATRMSLRQERDAPKMLDEVNEVFYSLKAPNSFATCAAIGFAEQTGTEVIVAGHLPILHCDGREVRELDTPGFPIGIMAVSDFRAMPVDFKPGEILAIVTDGFTEVFDKKGVELESGYIKRTLVTEYAQPLDRIASSLIAQANAWGPRSDDQSLLLVRRTA